MSKRLVLMVTAAACALSASPAVAAPRVTSGDLFATAAGQVGARAGVTALKAVGNAVATSAKGIDYTAVAQTLNPVYNNDGCLGAQINITSIALTNVGV